MTKESVTRTVPGRGWEAGQTPPPAPLHFLTDQAWRRSWVFLGGGAGGSWGNPPALGLALSFAAEPLDAPRAPITGNVCAADLSLLCS